jgi:transcriptional regulator with XRE-family HTH domain
VKKQKRYILKSTELCAIGQRIRKKRKALGWTMMDLAFETEIDYRQIGRIERGETNFTIGTLLRITHVFDMKLKDIIK